MYVGKNMTLPAFRETGGAAGRDDEASEGRDKFDEQSSGFQAFQRKVLHNLLTRVKVKYLIRNSPR